MLIRVISGESFDTGALFAVVCKSFTNKANHHETGRLLDRPWSLGLMHLIARDCSN